MKEKTNRGVSQAWPGLTASRCVEVEKRGWGDQCAYACRMTGLGLAQVMCDINEMILFFVSFLFSSF